MFLPSILFTLAIGLNYPWFLPILPAMIFIGQKRADDVWLISGLSPRMKQEWNRLQRTGVAWVFALWPPKKSPNDAV